jgi:hypothetical protein
MSTSTASPASILITAQLSSLVQPIAYLSDAPFSENVTHLPVYFAPGDTRPSEEAQLALAALADEAAVNASVLLTVTATDRDGVSAQLQDARAVSVFNTLSTLGVPMRAIALDLLEDEEALGHVDMAANAI